MVERKDKLFVFSVLIVFILELIAKLFVKKIQQPIVIIDDFLNIDFIKNYGAGFGILQNQKLFLIIISIAVIALIFYYYKKINKKIEFPCALVLAGTAANLFDRVIYSYVTDYISFSFWPAFNIADAAITIGGIWLIIYFYKN